MIATSVLSANLIISLIISNVFESGSSHIISVSKNLAIAWYFTEDKVILFDVQRNSVFKPALHLIIILG